MITFKDFMPRAAKTGDIEQFDALLERVNGWVHEHGVRVINVETVVLPNIQRTGDTQIFLEADDHM